MAEYSIVLVGRYVGRDRAVAQALSRAFGRDDAWGLQVVLAAPIVLLTNLNIDQASSIADALKDVEQAGSQLEIQQGIDEGLPKLQWPATPRIRGRLITEFGPSAAGVGTHSMMLIVPCPYTNQKIQLSLNMTFGRAPDGSVIPNVSATTAPYVPAAAMPQIPTPIPMPGLRQPTPSAPRQIVGLPPPIPLPGATPQNTARLTPGSGVPLPVQPQPIPTPQVQPPPVVIEGLDALDELTPMDQVPTPPNLMVPASKGPRPRTPVQAQPVLPAPQPIRPPGPPPPPPNNMAKPINVSFGVKPQAAPAPLPDVPVLHQQPKPQAMVPPPAPLSNNVMPMPASLSVPMDLSEFEATVTGSGLVAALQEEHQEPVDNPPANDDGSLYSVFIGKTNNPKAHQIAAEVLGVSPAEAQRLCQKPIVSLAKDIALSDAHEIRQRFAVANIQVRLSKKR